MKRKILEELLFTINFHNPSVTKPVNITSLDRCDFSMRSLASVSYPASENVDLPFGSCHCKTSAPAHLSGIRRALEWQRVS